MQNDLYQALFGFSKIGVPYLEPSQRIDMNESRLFQFQLQITGPDRDWQLLQHVPSWLAVADRDPE